MDHDALPPLAPRTSFATVLAFLGLLAMAAGWFLPWIARLDVDGMGISDAELGRLEEQGKREGVPDAVMAVVKRMRSNEAVSGRDLSVLGDHFISRDGDTLPAKERRGWAVGLAVMRWAPYALAGVALLLLLGRLRKPSFPVGTLVLSVALLVGGFAALLWIGASNNAREAVAKNPTVLGVGLYGIVFGGAAAFLGGLFGVRTSTWWKVYLLTILVVVGTIVGIGMYVDPR
ncbi:MAG: hypothetical protein U1E39_09245 [Planctomycetota bacterium]